jgi:creatinine amidohydrolase
VTLEFDAFAAVLRGVVRSVMRAGFKRVMLLNGHGGNAEAVAVVGGECQNEFGIAVAAGTYWHLAGDAFAPILERQSTVLHACEAETSMMMALMPEAVRLDRLPEAHGPHSTRPEGQPAALIRRRSFKEITPSGVVGDARSATAAKGEALLAIAAERIADELANAKLWQLRGRSASVQGCRMPQMLRQRRPPRRCPGCSVLPRTCVPAPITCAVDPTIKGSGSCTTPSSLPS